MVAPAVRKRPFADAAFADPTGATHEVVHYFRRAPWVATVLECRDVAASARFFANVLGFAAVEEKPHGSSGSDQNGGAAVVASAARRVLVSSLRDFPMLPPHIHAADAPARIVLSHGSPDVLPTLVLMPAAESTRWWPCDAAARAAGAVGLVGGAHAVDDTKGPVLTVAFASGMLPPALATPTASWRPSAMASARVPEVAWPVEAPDGFLELQGGVRDPDGHAFRVLTPAPLS